MLRWPCFDCLICWVLTFDVDVLCDVYSLCAFHFKKDTEICLAGSI